MALDPAEWLVWLGINTPGSSTNAASGDVALLKQAYEEDYGLFQEDVDGWTSYDEFEAGLAALGPDGEAISPTQAADIRTRASQRYSVWGDFQTFVEDSADWPEFANGFGGGVTSLTGNSSTGSGEPAAGIRIHDQEGLSFNGAQVPAGTVEVFGGRVEFSEQGAGVTTQPVTYSGITEDSGDGTLISGQTLTVTATVTNPNDTQVTPTVELLLDSSVADTKQVSVPANGSTTVSFEYRENDYVCYDIQIGTSGTVTVCWVPSAL